MIAYYPLINDLNDLTNGYAEAAEAEPEPGSPPPRREGMPAIIPGMLGKDHPNRLILLAEDGFDGKPVGSVSSSDAEKFWDYNTDHVFPPMKDLIRFGLFMRCNLYRILALTLKNEWERFFACDYLGWRPNASSESLSDILTRSDSAVIRKAFQNFNPDTQAMFDLFESCAGIASGSGYNARQFDTLVQEMLLKELHWLPGNSRELDHFIQAESRRIQAIQTATPQDQETFWIARCVWTNQQKDLEDILFKIENRRLKNRETERQWLCVFGSLEIQLFELDNRIVILEKKLMLKQESPKLNRKDIEQKFIEQEKDLQARLERLVNETAAAPTLQKPLKDGFPMDDEDLKQYQKECKTVIRKIYRMIHPDHLSNHPDYNKLTDKQKEELNRILQECLEIHPEELGIPEIYVEHEMRSLDGLKRVLEQVEIIQAQAGIDINPEFEIQGETLKAQLEWLDRENRWIEKQIASSRTTLESLMNNEDIRHKQSILDMPEQHEPIIATWTQQIEEKQKKADRLEQELNRMFL